MAPTPLEHVCSNTIIFFSRLIKNYLCIFGRMVENSAVRFCIFSALRIRPYGPGQTTHSCLQSKYLATLKRVTLRVGDEAR